MNKTIIASAVALLLTGCGGGSSSSNDEPVVDSPVVSDPAPVVDDPAPVVDDPAPVVDDPTPVVDDPTPNTIAAPLFAPVPTSVTCEGLDYINLISAQSDAVSTSGLIASNAIDNQLTAVGRWETTDTQAILTIDLGYRHQIKEIGTAWYQGDESSTSFNVEVSENGTDFTALSTTLVPSGETESFERFDIDDSVARFVRLTDFVNTDINTVSLLEAAIFGCPLDTAIAPLETQTINTAQFNLDPNATPGENFDLLTWALDTPEQDPDAPAGEALRTSETELDTGHEDEFFFTADDGGMVFKATIGGATTSENTSFTRSELREQLRRGNTSISTQGVNENNWVLGYQPETPRATGGRGGLLTATLKVDHVATTGSDAHEGRFIIGQIHAEDDEPIRLYFKKFADNERGYIYFAHEIRASADNGFDSTDNWFVVVGDDDPDRDQETEPFRNRSENPEQGIALGEIFSYEIDQTGSRIDVIVRRGDLNGPIIGHNYVDMAELNSGYDVVEEWNYFKAGTYVQNNTGDDDDFYQSTFYALSNTHEENTLIAEQQGLNLGSAPGNQFARITDSIDGDTGELRYQLPSTQAEGRLEVRFTRTDDDDGNTDGFITLFDSGTDNAGSILDLRVRDNSFQTRFPSNNIDTDIASVTVNNFQTAVITWEHPNGTSSGSLPNVTVAIDGIDIISGTTTATPFTPTGSVPAGGVHTVSFRFGNNDIQVPAAAMLAIDDIRIFDNIAGGDDNLVFEDDFESYNDGTNLDQAPYNSASSEVTVDTEQ